MDSVLPGLLSFPPHPPPAIPLSDAETDKGLRGVLKLLNETPAKKLTSGLTGGGGGDLLDILDPSVNTLPYLHVLVAHIHNIQSGKQAVGSQDSALLPGGRLWGPMLHFMENFDPIQIRYGGNEFRRLVHAIESAACKASLPAVAIRPIQLAISRLDPSGACFTSNHLMFLQLCLDTRQFQMARPVLDKDIYSFPSLKHGAGNTVNPFICSRNQSSSNFITNSSGFTEKITQKDILHYLLLGGMIYTALKDWERAIHFYELAILAPVTNAASKIQLHAYNKRLLVGLLWKGVRLDMPRTASPTAAKIYRGASKPYDALAEIFQDSIKDETNVHRLGLEIEAGHSVWQEDMNFGLVKQVFQSFRKFSVIKLSKTYSSMAVADIAKRTSSEPNNVSETAAYLRWLITTGQLDATLTERGDDHRLAILKFEEELEGKSEAQQLRELREVEARVHVLSARIVESDQKMGLSKEYLEWSRKAEAKSKDEIPGVPDALEELVPDEDMMVDI